MNLAQFAILYATALFAGVLLLLEYGRRLGTRRLAGDASLKAGTGAIEGAVFALLGLLIAFTFSGAAARFDARKALIVQEANAIGTAWLRLDVLPAEAQPALRDLFRAYVDSRIQAYRHLPDIKAALAELDRSIAMQNGIWTNAVAACRAAQGQPTAVLVLPSLNQMFDIVTTRTMAVQIHPPIIIFMLLGFLVLISALFAGMGMAGAKTPSWVHLVGYALVVSVCVWVILDLEYPRVGFIRVDAADRVLAELRESFK
jgi:hypothetical protein